MMHKLHGTYVVLKITRAEDRYLAYRICKWLHVLFIFTTTDILTKSVDYLFTTSALLGSG